MCMLGKFHDEKGLKVNYCDRSSSVMSPSVMLNLFSFKDISS